MIKPFYTIIFLIIILLVHVTCVHAQRRTVQEQHWLPLIQFEPGQEPATPKKKLGLIYFDPNGDFIAKDYDGNKTYFAGQNISISNFYEWAIDGNIIYVDGTNRSIGFFTNTPSSSAYIQLSDKLVICKTFTSAGIQACVDAIGGKGKVLLPKGIYHANSQITLDANDITIEGLGDATILTDTNDFIVFYHNGYGNITLRNLTIDGSNLSRAVGSQALLYLSVEGADNDGWINIEGCNFINFAGGGASVILAGDGNQVFNVSNCHFRNMANGTKALDIESCQSNVTRCSFVEVDIGLNLYFPRASNVTACTFSRNTDYSIASSAGGSVNIIGNGFYENSYRDVRMGNQGTLSGNTFRGNTGDYAAYIWSNKECSITANQFYTNDVIADICLKTVQRCTVTANQFYCDGTTDPNYHIYFSNGDDCIVASNVFDPDVNLAAIYMTSSDTGNIIYGNQNTSFAGSNRVYGDMEIYANVGIGTDNPTSTLHLLNDDDNANVLMLRLEGKRPTPANNDTIYIDYSLNNSTPASYEYARTTITAEDITAGDEEGSLLFEVSRNGTLEIALKLSATEIVLNEPGADRDFRIEALGAPNTLFIRGSDGNVGIGTASPDTTLDLSGTLSFTPSATQLITNAGMALLANAALVIIDPNNNYTLTSTPTIADGSLGQILKIICGNAEANSVALQDQDSLAGSNLQLGAASRTISGKDVLSLIYDGTDWIEDNYQDN